MTEYIRNTQDDDLIISRRPVQDCREALYAECPCTMTEGRNNA
jgi:hypothetical protein